MKDNDNNKPLNNEEIPVCGLCGYPMPEGEENFHYHGYSGPCPKPVDSVGGKEYTNKEGFNNNCLNCQANGIGCAVHHRLPVPTPPTGKEEWETRFDERFEYGECPFDLTMKVSKKWIDDDDDRNSMAISGLDDIKAFIRTEIAAARNEAVREYQKYNNPMFSVGIDRKWGGFDFGVRSDIANLSDEDMTKFREILLVGIGVMENRRREEKEKQNPPQVASLTPKRKEIN